MTTILAAPLPIVVCQTILFPPDVLGPAGRSDQRRTNSIGDSGTSQCCKADVPGAPLVPSPSSMQSRSVCRADGYFLSAAANTSRQAATPLMAAATPT